MYKVICLYKVLIMNCSDGIELYSSIFSTGVPGQTGGHPTTELSRQEKDTTTCGHGCYVGCQGI